jgi:hypothetical protein
MILKPGESGALPPGFGYRAVILLDPGVSLDHSVFLDLWRKHLRESIASRCSMDLARVRPRVYIIYAEEAHGGRYGAGEAMESFVPDNYYRHEVRARKRNPYRIHHIQRKRGMMAGFVRFEVNCHRRGMKAPWRFSKYGDAQPKADRRANAVLLEPDALDLNYLSTVTGWHHGLNVPVICLGSSAFGRLPGNYARWLDGMMTLTPEGQAYAEASLSKPGGLWTRQIPWSRFLTRRGRPKYAYGVADAWESPRRIRKPQVARSFFHRLHGGGSHFIPPESPGWADLIQAIDARYYLILSHDEGMIPYDAFLASAAGAVVVAPNVPAFRGFPGRKVLYPVRSQGNNRCNWAVQDVLAYLKPRLKP